MGTNKSHIAKALMTVALFISPLYYHYNPVVADGASGKIEHVAHRSTDNPGST